MLLLLFYTFRTSTIELTSDDTEEEFSDSEPRAPLKLPPEITLVLRNRDIKEGNFAKFACRVVSKKKVNVKWFKDDLPIKEEGRYIFENEDDLYALTVTKAKMLDAGHYKIVAENENGSVESSAYLSIERK